MPRRRDWLPGEDKAVRREVHLLGPGLGEAGAGALLDHGTDPVKVALPEAVLRPQPLRVERLQRLSRHEVHVEDPPQRLGVVGPRPVRRADGVEEHITRVHRERDRVRPGEQLFLTEALDLDMTGQVMAGEAEQAAVLDGGPVEVDVAVEVGDPVRVPSPSGPS